MFKKLPVFSFLFGLFLAYTLPLSALASEKQLRQAEKAKESGNYEAAQAIYESILKEDSYEERALMGLGEVHYWQGRYEASIQAYEKILEKKPQHLGALIGVGKGYLALGKDKKAQKYFQRAKKENPKNEEIETLDPSNQKKAKLRIEGGYITEVLNYAADTQGEYQEISILREKNFGFGLNNTYLNRFNQNVLETKLFGHYYFLENSRVDAEITFAPNVAIVPRQSYSIGLAHHFGKITPEIHYRFLDFQQANLHTLRGALYFEPLTYLRLGGGYEWQHLTFSGRNQEDNNGFARIQIGTPLDWLSFNALYDRVHRGFEAGRAGTPFINYSGHIVGGTIRIDMEEYMIRFGVTHENRSNGDRGETYLLSFGYSF